MSVATGIDAARDPMSVLDRAPVLAHENIGDELAEARRLLAQAIAQARSVVRAVEAPPSAERSIDEARALKARLDRFKGLVFAGAQSVKLAVSGNQINKASRRLCEAIERALALEARVDARAADLARAMPGHARETYARAAAALLVLEGWDAAPDVPPNRAPHVVASLAREGRLRLALFVCPPVDFGRLAGDRPELYVRTDMHGSVLSRHVDRLRDLFRGLEGAGIDVDLLAIVGDTDEEDYLWTGTPRPARLDRVALDARRDALVASVAAYIVEPVGARRDRPRILANERVRVTRMSAFAPSPEARGAYDAIVAAPTRFFDRDDVQAELAIMRWLFEPGSYYEGIAQPDDATLARIVVHKFATYAMQGVTLREIEPSLLLIQTERPARLRSKMLDAARRDAPLPTVRFYASEES